MTQVTLPKLSQSGTNEWADVEDNDKALRDVVNGNIDNTNLAAGTALANLAAASVTDTKLASPNNSVYKELLGGTGLLGAGAVAATYMFDVGNGNQASPSTSTAPDFPFIYIDDADYTVAGLTGKMRVRAQVATNATASVLTYTFGLYPVTVAGGANSLTWTLGTVVTGSTVAIASPAASTFVSGVGSDFAIPTDGVYTFGVVTSGTVPSNSRVVPMAQLQTRNV